jgi:AraC-like DNA-binding protein
MLHPIPLIRARTIRPLLEFRARLGLMAEREPKVLRDDEALIPLVYAGQLMESTAQAAGDPALGLRLAQDCRIETLPIIAHVLGAATLGEALADLVQWGPVFNTGEGFRLHTRGNLALLERWMASGVRSGRRLINDFSLVVLIKLIRRAAGSSWRPRVLWVEGPPLAYAQELAALTDGNLVFGAKSTVIAFPRHVLSLWLPVSRTTLAGATRTAELPASDFAHSVRQAVRSLLELGDLELSSAAEAAGSSVRSFQRRLSASGLSFAQLVDQARLDAATRLLRDPAARIIDVSAELGYTDSANFTRAFRRWAGVPPAEFRRASRDAAVAGVR